MLVYFRQKETEEFFGSLFGVSQAAVSRTSNDRNMIVVAVLEGSEPGHSRGSQRDGGGRGRDARAMLVVECYCREPARQDGCGRKRSWRFPRPL
ncbi:hypothetical protein C5C66_10400 [Rathayibacter toxicus]|uniref:hypothetical protein n=1 Tax=Rathayibacter toxicus TaxID=145458 RepID=UPI0009E42C9F|nr:hypothetical protein C5D15_10390 [Rathayibacter toxicus]PPG45969.1 hypothetical protein C5D16_10360 [Rathayibacter toxicus]PPH67157.1 hypothetical protein C5D01_10435 [Rathayibacter toxicus]PPH71942.1 hypothetical protein C5D24_10320 [Rathayibacter toxicus]PPH81381.1 hypothetical protein C5D20_10425 [Rathayibacter toxicus]